MTPSEELAAHRAELAVMRGAAEHYQKLLDIALGGINYHCAEIARLEREQKKEAIAK